MIHNFITKILLISDYELIQHKSGKDNLTYEIIPESGETFIIQQLSSIKSDKNLNFIEDITKYVHNNIPSLKFANNIFNNRFYTFHGIQFQVMEKLKGNSININNIDENIIKNTAIYIASFHNCIIKFETEKYSDINYYKKLKKYKKIAKQYILNTSNSKITDIFEKMSYLSKDLNEDLSLPKGVIHGDPSFKNFLIDTDDNILGLIDYDMLSVNTLLWDLSDLIRSYLKLDFFDKKVFKILLDSYNKTRKLSNNELSNLERYCQMMVLDTGFRYIISYFDDTNLIGDKNDSLDKAERCLQEFKKLNTFFK